MLRLHPARHTVSLHPASLADPGMRRADEILPPPSRRVEGDTLSVIREHLAQPEPEEPGLRPIDDHDTRRPVLVEQRQELLEGRRTPLELVVDGDLKSQELPCLWPDEGHDGTSARRLGLKRSLQPTHRLLERVALVGRHAPPKTAGTGFQPRQVSRRMALVAPGRRIRVDVRGQHRAREASQ